MNKKLIFAGLGILAIGGVALKERQNNIELKKQLKDVRERLEEAESVRNLAMELHQSNIRLAAALGRKSIEGSGTGYYPQKKN